MISFIDKSNKYLKTQKCFLLIIGIVFLTSMGNLCGCGPQVDISGNREIVVADKNECVLPDFFDTRAAQKNEKTIFTDKDNLLNRMFSANTEPLSKIFEKAFNIAERIESRKHREMENHYVLSDNGTFIKEIFSNIKNRFEIIETSYGVTKSIKDNISNKMIGKVAYLRNIRSGNAWTMVQRDKNDSSSSAPLFSKKQNDNYQILNPRGFAFHEFSQMWPFKLSANTP